MYSKNDPRDKVDFAYPTKPILTSNKNLLNNFQNTHETENSGVFNNKLDRPIILHTPLGPGDVQQATFWSRHLRA